MNQGQRIVAEIKLIRSALVEQDDRIQKLPRQAVWVIHHKNGTAYRLTYQPAPISAWSLHPPDGNASRLLGVIDRALNNQVATSNRESRTYHQQLHPWCIVRLLSNMQQRVLARFRRRNDAEAHLRILRQQAPSLCYEIMFDAAPHQAELPEEG